MARLFLLSSLSSHFHSLEQPHSNMKLHSTPSLLLTPHDPHHSLIPSLKQFFDLDPSSIPASYALDAVKSYYLNPSTNPLHPALLFCGAISMIVWFLGEVTGTSFNCISLSLNLVRSENLLLARLCTGNVSQVDRLWTTLPLVYSAHFTFIPYLNGSVSNITDLDHRMLLVFALQCCWSARLTYQSARRGFLDP